MIAAAVVWAACVGAASAPAPAPPAAAAPSTALPAAAPAAAASASAPEVATAADLWGGGASLAPNALRVWATVAVLGATGAWLTLRGRRPTAGPRPVWRARGGASGPLRVVAERALSGPHRLALVEVDGAQGSERLVVALSPQGASLLSRLPGLPSAAARAAPSSPGPQAAPPAELEPDLGGFGRDGGFPDADADADAAPRPRPRVSSPPSPPPPRPPREVAL